jgi:predicted amidophosphoribosyltransferase
MLLECNEVKLLIVNLEDVHRDFDSDLDALTNYVECVFIASGERKDTLAKRLSNCSFVEPTFLFTFAPGTFIRNILVDTERQPYEAVYVTGKMDENHLFGISTILLLKEGYTSFSKQVMPDHYVFSIEELINRLKGKIYGYFGELYAHGISGTGVFHFFEEQHLLHPDVKATLMTTGRYFTTSDYRAAIHPLTEKILQMKKGWQTGVNAMGGLLTKAFQSLKRYNGNINCITIVPPKPDKANVLNLVLQSSNIDRELMRPDLLQLVRHYQPQKEAGSWTNRALNVAEAFRATAEITGHVVLLDDIVTSGSTVMECARTLYNAGAHNVTILTFGASQKPIERYSTPIQCEKAGCTQDLRLKFNKRDNSAFFGCPNYQTCKNRGVPYEVGRKKFNEKNSKIELAQKKLDVLDEIF